MNNSLFYIWTATEAIIFLTFLFVCTALIKSRFTAGKTTAIVLASAALSAALNITILLVSRDVAFTLGLLPLTAYLPTIIVLHILSDSSFFGTVPTWCMGLFAMYVGRFSVKLTHFTLTHTAMSYAAQYAAMLLILLVLMSVICIVTIRYIRRPFNRYIRHSDTSYSIPLVLVLLIMALFSFFSNSTYNHTVSLLLFLTAVMSFFVIAKLFHSESSRQQLKKEQEEYEARIQAQQAEFKEITHKHELLREYRHDMRHHLLALSNILHDSDNTHAEEYIDALVGRLEATENIVYCKNQMINAVLSLYLTKAKKIGCVLDTQISIPEKLDIEDMDLCIILSNALENAVNACEREDENHRRIKIKINFQKALMISIKNNCSESVSFDKNGLPITAPKAGHGIGMKSIANTVEKYGGILKCEWENDEFRLDTVMFENAREESAPSVKHTHKPVAAAMFSLVGICVFLNLSPVAAEALADIPILGSVIEVVTARHYQFGWGQNELNVKIPKVILEPPIHSVKAAPSVNMEAEADHSTLLSAAMFSSLNANKAAAASDDSDANKTAAASDANNAAAPPDSSSVSPVSTPSAAPAASTVPATPATEASANSGTPNTQANTSSGTEITTEPSSVLAETAEKNPALEEGVEEINDKMNEYIETLRKMYEWYVSRKYMGYVALDTTYTTLCNNDIMLSIRFDSTLNAGSSANYSLCFTLDKRTGNLVTLTDLFQRDADFATPISSYILEQMAIQVESGAADYFIPGGIWSDEECFHSIAADQNFYINDQHQLVIVFDEGAVAPGSMGSVEFIIPTDVIAPILAESSLIQ